jgi:acetyl-CoA synthetase
MDGYYRGGQLADHKVKADEAVAAARQEGQDVDTVLVWRRHLGRYASRAPMVQGRDVFADELLGKHAGAVVEPVSMPAEAPLFLMYTSGTTGRPKGCQHSTGGYLAYVAGTSKYYQDIHPRRRVLVHGRHRLDHRAFLHRVRAAGAGHHHGDL